MRGFRPWTSQPPAGTPIDRDNALGARVLEHISLLDPSRWTVTGGALVPSRTQLGWCIDGTVSVEGKRSFSAAQWSNCTVFAAGLFPSTTSGNHFMAATGVYEPNVAVGEQSGPPYAAAGSASLYGPDYPKAGSLAVYALAIAGGNASFYENGSLVASGATGTISKGGPLTVAGVQEDTPDGTTQPWGAPIALGLLLDGALSSAEVASLTRNPWQIFHKRRRAYSIPTSSGAAGTAAITEASDTVSATGNIAIPGTASITEASDTVAATGAIAVAGTAAITEGSDTVAATGVGGEVGTAAITESSDSVSATGALSVTGSAGITEGADTVAATGAAGAGATAAITEQPDVVAATGGIALSGAAAIFEAGDIVVATGALGLAGTAAITEAPDSVAATGGLPPQVTQGAAEWTIARSATRNFSVRRSVPRSFTLSRSYTRNFTVNPMAVRFPVKGTSEKVPLTFDFTQDLPSGVTLTGTPTIGVSVSNGTDSNPTGILNGAAGFNSGSTQVIQPVQGGVNGADYSITCTCPTTQSNLTLSLVGLLSVRRDLN